MTRVALACSVYPSALPYFAEWSASGLAAFEHAGLEPHAIVIIDGIEPGHPYIADATRSLPGTWITSPPGRSVANVKEQLFRALVEASVDVAIFCDADDLIESRAISLHLNRLMNADVSVGDLTTVSETGSTLVRSIFAGMLPDLFETDYLRNGNVCGFSNTAISVNPARSHLSKVVPDVTAVDWWLFDLMLRSGLEFRGLNQSVARYRQHGANILGWGQRASLDVAQRRLRILAEHLAAMGDPSLATTALALSEDGKRLSFVLKEVGHTVNAWHSDSMSWVSFEQRRISA